MHTGTVSVFRGAGMAMDFACQPISARLYGYGSASQHIASVSSVVAGFARIQPI